MKYASLPDQQFLLRIFNYDPDTGVVVRRVTRTRGIAGTTVNTRVKGHIKTHIYGKEYYLHRLIWRMMTGEDPGDLTIDHKNCIGTDNRWLNLRKATHVQQRGNMRLAKNNISGVKGVHWSKDKKKWTAQISVNRKTVYLGRFHDLDKAKAVQNAAAILHFGEQFAFNGVNR